MLVYAISFLSGNVLLQQLPSLPGGGWLFVLAFIAIAAVLSRYPLIRFAGVFIFGFCWAWGAAFMRVDEIRGFDGGDAELGLRIISIPIYQKSYTRLKAEVIAQYQPTQASQTVPRRLRLNIYGKDPQLKLGDTIRALVRLKPLHGYSNPYTFDYERFLFASGIGATGYIRSWSHVENTTPNVAQKIRQYFHDKLLMQLDASNNTGAVLALTLGERGHMTARQWQLLKASGVGHLFAISGLHIAMLFFLAYRCAFFLWRKYVLPHCYLAAPLAAGWLAFVFAFVYAWLAGFSLPTQRALIMLGCVLIARSVMRRTSLDNTLALALLIILLLDPFSTLSASFWLSFCAVGGIIVFIEATRTSPKLLRWSGLQLYLPLVLLPLSLWFFNQAAVLAPLANLLAIPYAGFLVLPCVLLAALFAVVNETVASMLVWTADLLFDGFWYMAELVENFTISQWFHKPPLWSYFSSVAAVVLIIVTRSPYYRSAGVLFLAALTLTPTAPLPRGAFESTFLDVGQGLAVVIRTRENVLLFDTGGSYPSGFNLAAAVVIPFLHGNNITRLDAMVLSHGDNDHSGGSAVMLENFAVDRKYAGGSGKQPGVFSRGFEKCRSGMQWVWDDVHFSFLHPPQQVSPKLSENNASCVLRIHNGQHSLLLTGDIEAEAERYLLAHDSAQLDVTAISVPHHGSRTSSTAAFVAAVKPQVAVISSGFRNRFRFPAAAVVQRYRDYCAVVHDTADSGAVRLYFPPGQHAASSDGNIEVVLHRAERRRYWQTRDALPAIAVDDRAHCRKQEALTDI